MQVKTLITRIVASGLVLCGYTFIGLPFFFDQFSRLDQTAMIAGYENTVNDMDIEKINNLKRECIQYNHKIATQHAEEFYHYSANQDYSSDYIQWPEENTDLGTLSIPSIDVSLPIGHGTSEETLQVKVGHLYGTSLPCGGKSTHMVISGHTALRSSKMFDRLTELKEGNRFMINYLDEIHVYEVDQVKVVKPEEHDEYLQVIPNKDYVTLYTCTPYGINTHRLLVRGERVDTLKAEKQESDKGVVVKTNNTETYLKLGTTMFVIPFALVFFINKQIK